MLDSRLHLVHVLWLAASLAALVTCVDVFFSGSVTSQPSGLPLEHVQTYRRAEHGGSIRTFAILPHQVEPGSLTAGRKWARFMARQMTSLRWLWFSRARFTTENNIDRKYRRGPPELPSFQEQSDTTALQLLTECNAITIICFQPSPTTFDIITELQSPDKTTQPAASLTNWTSHWL